MFLFIFANEMKFVSFGSAHRHCHLDIIWNDV